MLQAGVTFTDSSSDTISDDGVENPQFPSFYDLPMGRAMPPPPVRPPPGLALHTSPPNPTSAVTNLASNPVPQQQTLPSPSPEIQHEEGKCIENCKCQIGDYLDIPALKRDGHWYETVAPRAEAGAAPPAEQLQEVGLSSNDTEDHPDSNQPSCDARYVSDDVSQAAVQSEATRNFENDQVQNLVLAFVETDNDPNSNQRSSKNLQYSDDAISENEEHWVEENLLNLDQPSSDGLQEYGTDQDQFASQAVETGDSPNLNQPCPDTLQDDRGYPFHLDSYLAKADGDFDSMQTSSAIVQGSDKLAPQGDVTQSIEVENRVHSVAMGSVRFDDQTDATQSALQDPKRHDISKWASNVVHHETTSMTVEHDAAVPAILLDDYPKNQADPKRIKKAVESIRKLKRKVRVQPATAQSNTGQQEEDSDFDASEPLPKRLKVTAELIDHQTTQSSMNEESEESDFDPSRFKRPTMGDLRPITRPLWARNMSQEPGTNDVEDGESNRKCAETQKKELRYAVRRRPQLKFGLDGADDDIQGSKFPRKPNELRPCEGWRAQYIYEQDELPAPASAHHGELQEDSSHSDQQVADGQRGGEIGMRSYNSSPQAPLGYQVAKGHVDGSGDIEVQNENSSRFSSPLSSLVTTPPNPFTEDESEDDVTDRQNERSSSLIQAESLTADEPESDGGDYLEKDHQAGQQAVISPVNANRQDISPVEDGNYKGSTANAMHFEQLIKNFAFDEENPLDAQINNFWRKIRSEPYVEADIAALVGLSAAHLRLDDPDHVHADIMAGRFDDVDVNDVAPNIEVDFDHINPRVVFRPQAIPLTLLFHKEVTEQLAIKERKHKELEEAEEDEKWFTANQSELRLEYLSYQVYRRYRAEVKAAQDLVPVDQYSFNDAIPEESPPMDRRDDFEMVDEGEFNTVVDDFYSCTDLCGNHPDSASLGMASTSEVEMDMEMTVEGSSPRAVLKDPIVIAHALPQRPEFPQGHQNRECFTLRFGNADTLESAARTLRRAADSQRRADTKIWQHDYRIGRELKVSGPALTNVRGWILSVVPRVEIFRGELH